MYEDDLERVGTVKNRRMMNLCRAGAVARFLWRKAIRPCVAFIAVCLISLGCHRSVQEGQSRVCVEIDGTEYTYQEFCSRLRKIYLEKPESEIMAVYRGRQVDISHHFMWNEWPVATVAKGHTATVEKEKVNVIEKDGALLVSYHVCGLDSPDEKMRKRLMEMMREKKREKLVFLFSAAGSTPLSTVMEHIVYVTQGQEYDGVLFGMDEDADPEEVKLPMEVQVEIL